LRSKHANSRFGLVRYADVSRKRDDAADSVAFYTGVNNVYDAKCG